MCVVFGAKSALVLFPAVELFLFPLISLLCLFHPLFLILSSFYLQKISCSPDFVEGLVSLKAGGFIYGRSCPSAPCRQILHYQKVHCASLFIHRKRYNHTFQWWNCCCLFVLWANCSTTSISQDILRKIIIACYARWHSGCLCEHPMQKISIFDMFHGLCWLCNQKYTQIYIFKESLGDRIATIQWWLECVSWCHGMAVAVQLVVI